MLLSNELKVEIKQNYQHISIFLQDKAPLLMSNYKMSRSAYIIRLEIT